MTHTLEDFHREIETRWQRLDEAEPTSGLSLLDLPQHASGVPLYLGKGRDGCRLLVPFPPDRHRGFRPDTASRGVQLLAVSLDVNGSRRWFLDVLCPATDLRWLFSSFVADVLLRIEGHPDSDATSLVRACFAAWRGLFAGTERPLGVRQLAGLFGELTLLERLLAISPGLVDCWKGPFQLPHDFELPTLHLEAKTTLSGNDTVHVHGIEQLAASDGAPLYLVHLRADISAGEGVGESVPAVVERLTAIDKFGRLPGLLEAAGYYPRHREHYDGTLFSLVEQRWFEVTSTFPRLTVETFRHGVPTGLGDFAYTLDLGEVVDLPLTEAGVAALWDGIAG